MRTARLNDPFFCLGASAAVLRVTHVFHWFPFYTSLVIGSNRIELPEEWCEEVVNLSIPHTSKNEAPRAQPFIGQTPNGAPRQITCSFSTPATQDLSWQRMVEKKWSLLMLVAFFVFSRSKVVKLC
ncbi:hypothetical protein CEXT_162481 [Caerostris extrusa]|uniref:Uncharacterized protein n=1 Tax=Caerostris extrusa TaxID=172846 RepID=A0AAV4M932_CAEEX|nr:hypothetical protein CEXT_162481 [Caerostris extrusa]